MAQVRVHPTAILEGEIDLAEGVEVGPHCSLQGRVRIGPSTVLMGHNYLRGPLTVGAGNRLYPFACLGFEPQDYKYDPNRPGAGLVIGDRNLLREHVTIHRATSDEAPTRIGSDCMFMVNTHAGHDAVVGDRCVLANNAMVAGHGRLYDQVNLGGGAAVAQKVAIGRLAFVGGTAGMAQHVPPFMMSRTRSTVGGLNLVGLRRAGVSRAEIDRIKWAFRVIYLERLARPVAMERLVEQAESSPAVAEILRFLRDHPGAICELEAGKESRAMLEAIDAD